jgi:FAD/FMN-containing dehydrogenase
LTKLSDVQPSLYMKEFLMFETGLPPHVPRTRFTGRVLESEDPGYDEARAVFNGMIDKSPRLIAQCVSTDDVVAAVRHGVDGGLEIAVRGGGHSAAGSGTTEGGMVIDLRRMNSVDVDPLRRVARAGGGATWADFDRATAKYGLATTGGRDSCTGVAGVTLGGGSGWQFGFACDNLLSVDLVTADGLQLTASETENPELFWALHGGGGNFGVVTSLTFKLHPVSNVSTAFLVWPAAAHAEVTRTFRDIFEGDAPPELGGAVLAATVRPTRIAPPELHGQLVTVARAVHTGCERDLVDLIEPLLRLSPLAKTLTEMPYDAFQRKLDAPTGLRSHWTAEHLAILPNKAIDLYSDWTGRAPAEVNAQTAIAPWGRAVAESADRWPLPHRKALWVVHPFAFWQSISRDSQAIGWVQELRSVLEPYSSGSVYLNLIGDEGHNIQPATRRGLASW